MIFWPSLHFAQVGYDLPALAEAYDWFNVMDYDYHGAWENFTGEAVVMMTSQGTTLYCTVLYCTVLYCTVLCQDTTLRCTEDTRRMTSTTPATGNTSALCT